MNKKFFTLVALLGLFVSFGANAQTATTFPMKSGNYYYLQTSDEGSGDLGYLSVKVKADSLVVYPAATRDDVPVAAGDSALWKVEYTQDLTSGKYTYTVTNKATKKPLSFSGNSNSTTASIGNSNKATLGGSLKFASGIRPIDTNPSALAPFYSYIVSQDSTLQLKVSGALADGASPVSFSKIKNAVATVGYDVTLQTAAAGGVLDILFVRPDAKYLTANELNAIENGRGFQLFGYYNGKAVAENNPLAGILFWADGATGSGLDKEVTLKAISLNKKKVAGSTNTFKDQYAYLDSISYSDQSNLPTDGSRMIFKVDTLPSTDGTNLIIGGTNGTLGTDSLKFAFWFDPSFDNDSVTVYINQVIIPSTTAGAYTPHKFTVATTAALADDAVEASAGWVPVQFDRLAGTSTDRYILTTGKGAANPNTYTRIAFEGDPIPGILDINKIYSVKNVNNAKGFKSFWGNVTNGKYYGVDLKDAWASLGAAYSYVSATQFVYTGLELVNREDASLNLGRLNKVKDGVYTNGTDTFEISVLSTEPTDKRVGYRYFSQTDLTNMGYTFDYMSGILTGRSLNVTTDSFMIANDTDAKVFKLVALGYSGVTPVSAATETAFGPADIENGAVGLSRQAYAIYSRDMKYVVTAAADGKLVITSVKSGLPVAYFSFRATETEGQYIMHATAENYTDKYNVNSTTAKLEKVDNYLANNEFAINNELAAPYVLDAKGHYTFMTARGEGLTSNANMFATYRKVGELKAEYTADDFKLYVDTAKVKGEETKPLYYILKGAEAGENAQLQGNFLRVMVDSLAKNPEVYGVTVEGKSLARLQFVPAKREVPGDSLLLNYTNEKFVKGDSIEFAGKNTGKINQFRFRIKYAANETGLVKLESEYKYPETAPSAGDAAIGWVAVLNNVIYLSKDEYSAMLVNMTPSDAPTGNAGDNAEAGFQVYGVQGGVIIQGAANQAVSITNVLGQTIAKKTIGSDYETISAGAGFVFVTINGETVKALVK